MSFLICKEESEKKKKESDKQLIISMGKVSGELALQIYANHIVLLMSALPSSAAKLEVLKGHLPISADCLVTSRNSNAVQTKQPSV